MQYYLKHKHGMQAGIIFFCWRPFPFRFELTSVTLFLRSDRDSASKLPLSPTWTVRSRWILRVLVAARPCLPAAVPHPSFPKFVYRSQGEQRIWGG